MATIPTVADNDLILTDWGNTVATELNNNVVKKTGGVITGNVSVSGTLSAGGRITCGGDMVALPSPQSDNAAAAVRRDWVGVEFLNRAGGTMSGFLHVGGPATAAADGVSVRTDGAVVSTVTTGAAPNSLPNLLLGRTGTQPQAVGGTFVRFERTSAGTDIGSITIASASAVAYNTTSDPRLKEPTGDVADAADIVHDLGAKVYRGRWIADQGQGDEWVFLNSTDVEAVAPFAVAGEPDATGPGGEIIPQQLDHSALVPLLFAALAQALDRIAALEAA